MARNVWYPKGLSAIMTGDVDLEADTLALVLVDDTFVFNVAHDFLDDIPSGQRVGSRVNVAGSRTVAAGVLTTSTPTTTFTAVTGDDVAGAVLIVEGGSDSARRLLHVWERQGDTTEILAAAIGDDIAVSFAGGVIARLSGGA